MRYLVTELMFPLILAVLLGGVVGWATCSRRQPLHRHGFARWTFAAFAAGAVAVFARALDGMPALWLEIAVLLAGAFLLGCGFICALRQLLDAGDRTPPARETAPSAEPPQPPPAARAATPAAFVPVPAEPPPPPPTPTAAPPEGVQPAGLAAPRAGRADDLKRIRGVGPQNEGRLHGLGVWHFDQIAAWSPDEAAWVGGYLAFPGRIEREQWVAQAKVLAAAGDTEFSRRVARGEVPTSAEDGGAGQAAAPAPARKG